MTPSDQISKALSESDLCAPVMDILARLQEHGGRGLLVGGCVRDALLGQTPHDIDIEIYGMSLEALCAALKNRYRLDTVGASFGVTKVLGLDIDLALPRSETKLGEGHRAFGINVRPDLSFAEATARRDLTVNAIMFDPLSAEIIDPWNGLDDLAAKILRHVSPHFSEDPLRVLRLMQFAARLQFTVAPETIRLCQSITPEGLPRERLGGEWEKLLLKGVKPSVGMAFLRNCGWIQYYPELQALIGCEQTPIWHPEGDVWNHTLMALDHAATLRSGNAFDDLAFMAAVLCHDMGKPAATRLCNDGCIRSRGHDLAGIPIAQTFIRRLWLNNDLEPLVLSLVACHMRAFDAARANSDKAIRRLAVDARRLDLLANVFEADMMASKHDDMTPLTTFSEAIHRLDVATAAPKRIVLGRHLVERGLKPSAEFKTILDKCYEAQLDGVFSDLAGGLKFLSTILP